VCVRAPAAAAEGRRDNLAARLASAAAVFEGARPFPERSVPAGEEEGRRAIEGVRPQEDMLASAAVAARATERKTRSPRLPSHPSA